MEELAEPAEPRGRTRTISREFLLPIVLGSIGLFMANSPMILSKLGAVQTDLGDSRLINYILEHSYLWIRADPGHREFWSPPFFYPARNVAAYSDVLLTVSPIYWGFRGVGAAPDTAFQLWMIAISAVNFLVGYLVFRRGMRFPAISSAAGAFLVAFGAPRINQIGHQQLLPYFFGLIAILGIVRAFSDRDSSLSRRFGWWLVATAGLVAQLYAGFYNGWFLMFGGAIAAAWAIVLRRYRARFLRAVREDSPAIVASAAVGALALWPFLAHYLRAARELGARDYQWVRHSMLEPWSWIHTGPHHWLWGRMAGLDLFRELPMEVENRVGLGLVTPVVCAVGLYVCRDRALARLAALVAMSVVFCTTFLPGAYLADLALGIVLVVATRFFLVRDDPRLCLLVLGSLLTVLTFERFPSWRVIGIGFFTMGLCLAESFRVRRDPYRLVVPLLLLLWVGLMLFDILAILMGLALVAPLVVVAEILRIGDRTSRCLSGALACVWLLAILSYPHEPGGLAVGLLAPVLLVPALGRVRLPVAPRSLTIAAMVSVPAIVLLENNDTLWVYVFGIVPGATAIRAVARAGLLVLVPAAIGFAMFFTTPWARRRPILAMMIGLFCIVEQGLTTPAYDKAEERAHIAALSRRVDPSALAFYYRPGGRIAPWVYHVDAMWMSLATRVPTINGYSGGWPPGWAPLMFVDRDYGPTVREARPAWVRDALAAWVRYSHLPADRVQRIGGE
ncbi:MAG: hypothetical protein JWN86_3260 [Planctomycetota bacterium]|nr:hypothetical protein [Planctomycetota bacterium]